MTNGIAQRQLEQYNLDRLAAQRQLYSKAKSIQGIQVILSVPTIIVIALLSHYLRGQHFITQFKTSPIDISWFLAASGVFISLLDLACLSPIMAKSKELAAKIQELFDCDVLDLQWNAISADKKPNPEIVNEYAIKYRKTKANIRSSLENWYSIEVDKLPLSIARIICQRSNMRWDIELRMKCSNCVSFLAVITFSFLLLIGILNGLTVKTFFLVVLLPVAPIFLLSITHYQKNKKSTESLENLKTQAEKIWDEIIKLTLPDDYLNNVARQLQDCLYNNRKINTPIFDFVYEIFRDSQEDSMNYASAHMIAEYEKTKNSKPKN